MKLQGKVALITGGNSGIGLATARLFQSEGATVAITVRGEHRIDEARQALGDDVHIFVADQANIADSERLFAEIEQRLGRVDLLFLNAGIVRMGPIESVTEADFDAVMDVNLKGVFFTIQKALPHLNDGGSIVLNTSINANIGMPGTSVYGASKAAVVSLARTLSADLQGRGIRVNALSPGPIQTPIFGKVGLPQEALDGFAQQVQQQVPLGRFGKPEEIAKAALFLASDDSSFVLGTELVADGGMSQL